MGHFYNPPPPSQGPVNSTPPIPHAPIPAQGDQPPRRQVANVLMMVAVLASWPADQEPRLQAPNNTQQKIAPLTLTYGQQPPPRTTGRIYPAIVQANEDLLEIELVSTIVAAPSNPDPPPIARPPRPLHTILAAWQPDVLAPQGPPETAAWNVPPIVAGYIPKARVPDAIYAAHQPPDPLPVQRLRSIVPTFPAVSQPMPTAPLSTLELAQVVASWPSEVGPILPWANATPTRIAPLTLPTGTPPVPQGPLSVLELTQLVGSWAQTWDAQTAPKNAGWNVPPVLVSLPHVPPPSQIWTAWESPWIAPPKPVQIAPLTLVYGDAPPVQAPLSVAELTTIEAPWTETWTAQTAPKNAAWNVPPLLTILPYVPLPGSIRAAWEPPWIAPPAPVRVAPLTLVYGQTPSPRAPLTVAQAVVQASWPADLEPRLCWPNNAETKIAPLTLAYGQAPQPGPPIRPAVHTGILVWHPAENWPAQANEPSIVWTIAPPPQFYVSVAWLDARVRTKVTFSAPVRTVVTLSTKIRRDV